PFAHRDERREGMQRARGVARAAAAGGSRARRRPDRLFTELRDGDRHLGAEAGIAVGRLDGRGVGPEIGDAPVAIGFVGPPRR
ncbi:MAG TPA: hypothetical protein VK194_06670, partial [Candidatus Deferrimicrobium sp.]|nr:hypothetical protein [Candidatus Deferrimicrobium sp.]